MLEQAGGAHRARGRALRVLLVLFLVLALLLAGAFGFYVWATGSSGPSRQVTVEIPQGATVTEMGRALEEAGVIRSAFMFGITVRLQGIGAELKAGTYDNMRTNMRLAEALDLLQAGPPPEKLPLSVTVPEGLRIEEVAETLAEGLSIRPRAFLREARSGGWAIEPWLPEGTETVEGFLFPKTYDFPEGVRARAVLRRMLAQFEEEVSGLEWSRAEALGLEPYEVVVMASLIEREARVPKDRRKISAVIHNRLERDMPLEIDATVQYALPEHKERLTFDDLEYESPYNTYLFVGLPPGPIASPGVASIEAALNPADGGWLYYVLIDPETGEHAFAETYEEFLEYREQAGLG
ncbi:MAG TPA: endolytic transglycosylase MltG [Actinomycetota bacterium]